MFKTLLLTTFLAVSTFSYTGTLHAKFMMISPGYLRMEEAWEADTVEKYMSIMTAGAQSPDADYPNLKIPEDRVPEWLKPLTSTSIGKWEHTLIDDLPKEIETLIKEIAKLNNIEYKYADKAIMDWLNIAEIYYMEGKIDSAMWHLSRACHLIQDITVPMHCKIKGNLIDVWQVLNHQEPNHDKFEKYCTEYFITGNKQVNLKEEFKLPDITYEIAKGSRKTLKYCDGIGSGFIFNVPPLKWLFPCLVENYEKAMTISGTNGEIYTVKLIHYFFQRVTKPVQIENFLHAGN